MNEHKYLIVGGGMTAAAASRGIRDVDEDGSIGIISAEDRQPYDRPPLTKQLWTGDVEVEEIWQGIPDGVTFYLDRQVTALDLAGKKATDDRGDTYSYDRLLLATGGRPRRLPFGGDHIIYYRDLGDYRRLRALVDEHDRFAVIGGGFIGSEIAAALAMNGKQVAMLFPEPAIGANLFPADLAHHLNRYYEERGVEVLAGQTATGLEGAGADLTVVMDGGRRLHVNGVVAGIGIAPGVALAQAAGLEVDDGVVVDKSLQAGHPDVYASGDVASFPDPVLGSRRRVEHVDAAITMGETAGRSMAGADVVYDHSPMFYSDLFDYGYEAVGRLDSRLQMVQVWRDQFDEGVVYYLDGGRVRGVLLWNVWGEVDTARELIARAEPLSPEELEDAI